MAFGNTQLPCFICAVFVFNFLESFQIYRKLKKGTKNFLRQVSPVCPAFRHICSVMSLAYVCMVSEHGGLPAPSPGGHFPLQGGKGDPRCRAHLSGFLLSSLLDPANPHYFVSSLMPLNTLFKKICSQVFPAAEERPLVLQSRGSQGPAEDSSGPCTLLPGPWPFLPGPLGLRQDIQVASPPSLSHASALHTRRRLSGQPPSTCPPAQQSRCLEGVSRLQNSLSFLVRF